MRAGSFVGAIALAVIVASCGCTGARGGEPVTIVPRSGQSEAVVVERVIDGDTFVLTNGEHVRVLGINSCEQGSVGGKAATAQAKALLLGGVVTLVTEPGVDRDRWDRLLRYVHLSDGRDFGSQMVSGGHTEVYRGRNDASPEYVSDLRGLDWNGRSC